MSLRIPVNTQEPVYTADYPQSISVRRFLTRRVTATGVSNDVRLEVPMGKRWIVKSVYLQEKRVAGAQVRQTSVAFWANVPTMFSSTTNYAFYASAPKTGAGDNFVMLAPGLSYKAVDATGTYETELIPIASTVLQATDWIYVSMFECAVGDVLTLVVTVEEF